jgi:hypothetical protein
MIRHPAVGVQPRFVTRQGPLNNDVEQHAVLIRMEYGLAMIAAQGDVIDATRDMNT